MDTHELTEKELKKLDEAASTVKKFAKYIKEVNLDNYWLRKNLDESIKAGDVTNEQKVHLRCYNDAEFEYRRLVASIREKCPKDCDCPNEKHDACPMYQEFVIADWMQGVAHGHRFDWDFIFKYALVGRMKDMEKYAKGAAR